MSDFKVRALEMHSLYAWDFERVKKSIDFMKRHGMNTLVLHRNDFIDLIVYPSKYFGGKREKYNTIFERYQDIFRVLYKYTPTRRSGPYQRRAYLKRVLEEARRSDIEVFIENKELYFPEILPEFHPELLKNGKLCANEPFWWDFTRTKYQEFFEEFPEIGGIITAPATGESKISISSNRCTCELCKAATPQDWYRKLIMSMYEPISAAGKRLAIRDFVFNAKAHNEIASTMEQLPNDVIIALKNTPHDYYPTFPDNPRIGKVGDHEQWIEFDSMAQYFGWGIGPSIMTEDYRRRMKLARENGAEGVIIRTDWESLDGHTAFDTPNFINLYAVAALTNDLDAESTGIYDNWLEEQCFYKKDTSKEDRRKAALWVESFMKDTWEVIKRTVYVNDCVFSDSSLLPVSIEHALWLAEEKNSLKDWDKSKENALSTDIENLKLLLEEKDEALRLVRKLLKEAGKGNGAITEEGNKYFVDWFEIFERYVRAFRLAAQSIFLTKHSLNERKDGKDGTSKEIEAMRDQRIEELLELAAELEEFAKSTSFQFRVYALLDPDRLRALHYDLCRRLSGDDYKSQTTF